MSDNSKLPTHNVFIVTKRDPRSSRGTWHQVGAAWAHSDGDGLTLRFHDWITNLPITDNAQLVIRTRKTDEQPHNTSTNEPTPTRTPVDDIPF